MSWRPLLVAALLLSTIASASADDKRTKTRTVGILDVRLEGAPEDVKREFEKSLEEQLDTSTYWLASRAQMRERLKFSTKWTEGCLVGACLTEAKVQTNAELVLLVALSGSGTSYGYVVTLARTDTGKVVAQESGRCDVCPPREAMREATLATINLLNNVPDTLPDDAAVHRAELAAAIAKANAQVDEERRKSRGGRTKGIVVTVVGLAVAAAGVGLYYGADKPGYALAVAGAGGGMALGGVAILTF